MRCLLLTTFFSPLVLTQNADQLNFETLDLASQLANIDRDFRKNKVEIDNFIKESLSAKPARQDESITITQHSDLHEPFPLHDRISEPETGSGSYQPELTDDEDELPVEKVKPGPVLITEAPTIVREQTTGRNLEYENYYAEENIEDYDEDYNINEIPLETVTDLTKETTTTAEIIIPVQPDLVVTPELEIITEKPATEKPLTTTEIVKPPTTTEIVIPKTEKIDPETQTYNPGTDEAQLTTITEVDDGFPIQMIEDLLTDDGKYKIEAAPDMLVIIFVTLCILTMMVTVVAYVCYRIRKKDEGSYLIGTKV